MHLNGGRRSWRYRPLAPPRLDSLLQEIQSIIILRFWFSATMSTNFRTVLSMISSVFVQKKYPVSG